MARRKHSKIDLLEPKVKDEVESMILSNNFTYKEIVEYIQDTTGTSISQQAVFRYAKGLSESLASIRMAQETFKAVQQELNRNPDLDTTEGIIQLLSHLLLNYVCTNSSQSTSIKNRLSSEVMTYDICYTGITCKRAKGMCGA